MRLFVGRYFMKNVLVSLVAVVAAALIISLSSFRFVTGAFDRDHIGDQVKIAELITTQLDGELESVVKSASSLLMDQEVLQAIYAKDMEQQSSSVQQIQHKLITYSKNVKNIYSADLYLPVSNLLISSTNGIITASAISDETVRLYQTVEALRKPLWMYTKQQSSEDVISFFQPLPVQSNFPQAYLAVHIRERAINNIIKASKADIPHEALVISESGKVISSENKSMLGKFLDSDKQRMLKDILDAPNRTGYIMERSTDTFTAFSRSSSTEWVTALRFPSRDFFSYKDDIFRFTAFLLFTVAVVALVVLPPGYFYMYTPVVRLIRGIRRTIGQDELAEHGRFPDEWELLREGHRQTEAELRQLQERSGKMSVSVKELALFRLLHGSYAQSAPEHLAAFIQEQGLDERNKYWTLVVEPEPEISESNFNQDEPSLQLFAISNLCEEILRQNHLDGFVLPSLDMKHVIVLCSAPLHARERQLTGVTVLVAESVQNAVDNYLKLSVSIGIGDTYTLREGIHHTYSQSCECLRERLVLGLGRIITTGDINQKFIYTYPYELESSLLKELKMNNQEECLGIFGEMFRQMLDARVNAPTVIKTAYALYLSILRVVDEVSDGASLQVKWEVASPPCWDTMEDLLQWFRGEFFPEVFKTMDLMNENKGRQTIEAVKEYLYETVTQTHSLTSVAEQFGLNPSYLSRLFKKLSGQSFVQFTANLKIEKAKQLLLTTQLSVFEIAEAVGYTERTFGRVFKNVTGTTPANYRVQHKN
ncbi:helix-turn-helix domain-containing protein [Paenibacillus thalictri]|uniref:AraC family transcriptional regulator n=1 Tax=Paenibacillus thalictri TaxID=2527873 RepID=A0A4Q9DWJ8_9BACL|nr:helix-turn-helix domain-containing protein [Paenibacillus thalictri]TBL80725.1 AraC family transcriptional regulator [Paenibacillus thalictri]